MRLYMKKLMNPGRIIAFGFFSIILIGALLFLLPISQKIPGSVSFVDALFTSTSAVCVTGLIVVDTGTFFTQFGQIIILMLIQAGGIGIMTFTSYFSYFFQGVSS